MVRMKDEGMGNGWGGIKEPFEDSIYTTILVPQSVKKNVYRLYTLQKGILL